MLISPTEWYTWKSTACKCSENQQPSRKWTDQMKLDSFPSPIPRNCHYLICVTTSCKTSLAWLVFELNQSSPCVNLLLGGVFVKSISRNWLTLQLPMTEIMVGTNNKLNKQTNSKRKAGEWEVCRGILKALTYSWDTRRPCANVG